MSLRADVDGARIALQCDVGFGGPVVPAPQERDFPTLLLFPAPRIRVYARETIVAEKCEAMVSLGIQNSRMKDFFDLYGLARQESFSGPALCGALHHTFTYRQTPFPATMPLAWSAAFGADGGKLDQWSSFVRRLGTTLAAIPTLESVTALLGEFLWPPLASLGTGESFEGSWPPGGPWQER